MAYEMLQANIRFRYADSQWLSKLIILPYWEYYNGFGIFFNAFYEEGKSFHLCTTNGRYSRKMYLDKWKNTF